jgi:signal peptidase I
MLIVSLAIAAALVLALLRVVAARRWLRITVTGNSMSPTFLDGQRLVVQRRRGREPRTGEAIVFEAPADRRHEVALRLKRVAATGGEEMPAWASARFRSAVVPAGYLLVVGDNAVSEDFRQLGLIAVTSVLAIVDEPGTTRRAAMLPTRGDAMN